MVNLRVAVPTKGDKGLEDFVSEVFGRSEKFTILEIIDGSVVNVEVVENPAGGYEHGAGPIVVKMLKDMGVTAVAAREFGPGVTVLLEQSKIKMFKVEAGMQVGEIAEKVIKELER